MKKRIPTKKIVVTGDLAVVKLEVATAPTDSDPQAFPSRTGSSLLNWQTFGGVRSLTMAGGALLLAEFVKKATAAEVLCPERNQVLNNPGQYVHSLINLAPFPEKAKDKEKKVYRIAAFRGYRGPGAGSPRLLPVQNDDPDAGIVVLDDDYNGFHNSKTCQPLALKRGNPLVLLKTHRPLAQGDLWLQIQKDHAERTVVVMTANDLRRDGIKISRRLSWERTAQDLVRQLDSNPRLIAFNNCARVIVRIGVEGALLYSRNAGIVRAQLFYDPKLGEEDFRNQIPGEMTGLSCAFAAEIVAAMASGNLDGLNDGIRRGLQRTQRLWRLGFGTDEEGIDFPTAELFRSKDDEKRIRDVIVSVAGSWESLDADQWRILDDVTRAGLERSAYNYVIRGRDEELDKVPVGEFRNLRTVDRSEIESFRSIKNLIQEYLKSPADRPLSIAVFGTPGSGKSFGVTEVAESVAPGRLEKLEFNLSQFNSTDDLVAAFHRVRDIGLSGKMPFVFFDEFDSNFKRHLGWLKYFLAPMQDGKFRERESFHPIGRAIFVFAGGTCDTFQKFAGQACQAAPGENQGRTGDDSFEKAKGPDFLSRLRGYVDIKGPNPGGDEQDRLFMIRRALLLRFILQQNAPHLEVPEPVEETSGSDNKAQQEEKPRKKLAVDPGVLRAFIKVSRFEHGVRSISAIVEMSLLAGRTSYEQAALPSPEQLSLHVDPEEFNALVERDVLLGSAREALARAVHEKYRKDQKGKKSKDDPAMKPWTKLTEDLRESNRQQGDSIPAKLEAIGYDFVKVQNRKPEKVLFTDAQIEKMAELEHDRWNKERWAAGWKLGPRDPKNKQSPYLVAWEELPDDIKEYDRDAVRAIPEILARAGFEVYRVK